MTFARATRPAATERHSPCREIFLQLIDQRVRGGRKRQDDGALLKQRDGGGSVVFRRSGRLVLDSASGGVGFEPTIEVAPDAGFQDVVLVIQTSSGLSVYGSADDCAAGPLLDAVARTLAQMTMVIPAACAGPRLWERVVRPTMAAMAGSQL